MDVHQIDGGVAMDDVARAHLADLQTQDAHDVRYLRYWVDEENGRVFCLVEAPTADAATSHRSSPRRRPDPACRRAGGGATGRRHAGLGISRAGEPRPERRPCRGGAGGLFARS
jgi:Protein of unknown function (DUF4242)